MVQPLQQSPPNKWTEILWGIVNCFPPFILGITEVVDLRPSKSSLQFLSIDKWECEEQSTVLFLQEGLVVTLQSYNAIHCAIFALDQER